MERVTFSIPGYSVVASSGEWPEMYSSYCEHALLVEELDLSAAACERSFFAVTPGDRAWPSLVVLQHYEPSGYGFHPGILIVPETSLVFIGAGARLLAYCMEPEPRRLWEDKADVGFWSWAVHEDVVLMSAELELAAWTNRGRKLWSTFADPPWHYRVDGQLVTLTACGGDESVFSLTDGPARAR